MRLKPSLRRLSAGVEEEAKKLLGDSAFVAVGVIATTFSYMTQIALISHLLGLRALGTFSLVVALVTLVQQFFDLRVEAATITVGAQRLGSPRRLAGILQLSYLIDLATGIAGFAISAVLALTVGSTLTGGSDPRLILVFSLTLLVSTLNGTSGAALKLLDEFRLLAVVAAGRESVRVLLVSIVLIRYRSLLVLFIALVVLEAVNAAVLTVLANRRFKAKKDGLSMMRRALHLTRDVRGDMRRLVFHSNLISYSRIAKAQLPTLLLGIITGPLEVATYKLGTTAGMAMGRATDPLMSAIAPRVARLWAAGKHEDLGRLVRQATLFAGTGVTLGTTLLVFFRGPVLDILGGEGGRRAATVLVFVALGQAMSAALFWNGPFMMATGGAPAMSKVTLLAMAGYMPLLVLLAQNWGAEGAAAALMLNYVAINVPLTVLSLKRLTEQGVHSSEKGDPR